MMVLIFLAVVYFIIYFVICILFEKKSMEKSMVTI